MCLIILKHKTIYFKSKISSNREILIKKMRIFTPLCLLYNGEVIIKGSNCVNYVTVCATIRIAHFKNSSLCEYMHSQIEIIIVR